MSCLETALALEAQRRNETIRQFNAQLPNTTEQANFYGSLNAYIEAVRNTSSQRPAPRKKRK